MIQFSSPTRKMKSLCAYYVGVDRLEQFMIIPQTCLDKMTEYATALFFHPTSCQQAHSQRHTLPRQLITSILPTFSIWRVSMVIQITPQNLMNCSMYHCRIILTILLNSAHNLLSDDHISDCTVSMVIQIATKI